MRKFPILIALCFLPMPAGAQQTPLVEVFGGYSNLTANLNATSFNLSGVGGSVAENLNSWFGGALDFSTHFGTENGFKTNMQTLTYGPVFSYRKNRNFVGFSHILLGAVRGGPEYLDISKGEYRFGAYLGGGFDLKVSPNVSLRLIQADYLYTRFSGLHQDNIRLSAGIVLRLGKKR